MQDDPQSRFINERAHGNIQKDGTFSVVPRMYCGITPPDQLRRIADVADKYKIPTVKVTGGQRIDLFGIDYIRQQVVGDADKRKALHERLLYTLQGHMPDVGCARNYPVKLEGDAVFISLSQVVALGLNSRTAGG